MNRTENSDSEKKIRPARRTLKVSGNRIPFYRNPVITYLTAFLVPIAVMLIIFAGKNIYPFGEQCFLRTDLYHQYAPFFREFKDKLSAGESLAYTWDIGLGTNFLAIYAYYLASPLNWLLYLCPADHVIEFITYGIVFRMALSSLTMTWYLNARRKEVHFSAALFGIFYGLSGYMAAYSWNIMWLDCLFLFPVIMLGLERLVKEGRWVLYCISLGFCIFSNYYISIMVCISAVLFFLVLMILHTSGVKNFFRGIFLFAISSLLAGGLAAIVLIPEIYALSGTASGSFNFPQSAESYFSIMDMLTRHIMNTGVEIGLDHWPNIYCGVGIFLFIPFFYMSRNIRFREKVADTLLILFFLLSFSLNILNFIWHGFHYPNSLPCRQSFVYIFLILAMSHRGFLDLKERSRQDIVKSIALAVVFIVIAQKLAAQYTGKSIGDDYFYTWSSFYLSIAFVIFYGGLTSVLAFGKKYWKPVLAVAAVAAVLLESTINMAVTSVTTVNRTTYVKDDETIRDLVAQTEEAEGTDFYRVEKTANRTKNDGAWLDYHSASIFSSMAYADLTAIYKKFGLESSTNAYGTTGSSWISNMFLGIRYSISSTELEENDYRTLFASENDIYLYKNTYALPLGFLVDSSLSAFWNTTNTDPALNWNSLVSALGIDGELFTAVDTIVNNNTSVVTLTSPDTKDSLYIYCNKSGPGKVRVTYDGYNKEFSNLSRSYFISLDSVPADTLLTLTNTDDTKSGQGISVTAYTLNESVLQQVYDILSSEPLSVASYDSTSVSGTVTASHDQVMLTSIPYDAGWEVKIDGVVVETSSFEDAFLSFPVSAGTHTVSMNYTPSGSRTGLLITLISLILLGMMILLRWQWRKTHREENLTGKRPKRPLSRSGQKNRKRISGEGNNSDEKETPDDEDRSDRKAPSDEGLFDEDVSSDNGRIDGKDSSDNGRINGEVSSDNDRFSGASSFDNGLLDRETSSGSGIFDGETLSDDENFSDDEERYGGKPASFLGEKTCSAKKSGNSSDEISGKKDLLSSLTALGGHIPLSDQTASSDSDRQSRKVPQITFRIERSSDDSDENGFPQKEIVSRTSTLKIDKGE